MTISEPEIGAAIAALTRAGALAATAPVIGDPGVPVRARVVFVVAIGLAAGANRPGVLYSELPLSILVELFVGLLTGLVARFIVARAATAGQLVGLSLGLGFASQFDIRAGESASTMRSIFTTLAGLAFLSTGGLEALVRGVAQPAHISQLGQLGPVLIREGTASMGRGLALAAPVVLAALVANLGLAIVNRAVPSANVFSIALTAVLLLGGAVLVATAPDLIMGLIGDAQEATAVLDGST